MHRLSKNRCNMYQIDRLLVSHSIIYGMSFRFGRQPHRLRLAVFFDRSRAKSTTGSFFVAQMTTFHQARGLLRLDRGDLVQSAYQLMQGIVGLFFKPSNDGTPRNAERSFKSTQTTPLLIGTKNLLPSFKRISRQLRIVTTLASTGAAAIFLLAVWRDSILMERCIAAMTAYRGCGIHGVNPFSSPHHEQYTTPFGQRPLPFLLWYAIFRAPRGKWHTLRSTMLPFVLSDVEGQANRMLRGLPRKSC